MKNETEFKGKITTKKVIKMLKKDDMDVIFIKFEKPPKSMTLEVYKLM